MGNWHGVAGIRASLRAKIVRWISHMLSQRQGLRAKGNTPACMVKRDEWNLGYCQSGKASWRREGLGLGFTNKG